MRLDAFLARAGWGSRKEVKKLIRQGKVRVEGEIVRDPGYLLKSGSRVEVEGQTIPWEEHRYYILHKPAGYVTSTQDLHPTVMDLLEGVPRKEKLFPVGRLDKDAEGLLLITDDGPLAHRLTHPRYRVPRVYQVWVAGNFPAEKLVFFQEGMELEGRLTLPAEARILENLPGKTLLEVTLYEGRHHQIKRMFARLGFEVLGLKRIRFGPLVLGDLPRGHFRKLSEEEVQSLRQFTSAKVQPPR